MASFPPDRPPSERFVDPAAEPRPERQRSARDRVGTAGAVVLAAAVLAIALMIILL